MILKKIIAHIHSIQNTVYRDADAPEIFEKMGVKFLQGKINFIDKHTINVLNPSGKPSSITCRMVRKIKRAYGNRNQSECAIG